MAEPSVSPIILKMLFGLGDSKKPLESTACIIEEYLQQQLDCIIYKAHATSGNQDSEDITVKNILFLMRNNPVRLQRVYHYFDEKSQHQKITGGITGAATTDKDIEADLKNFFSGNKKSRNLNVKQHIVDFLDEFKIKVGDYVDEGKNARLIRQNELSIEHSKEDYLLFQQSRSVSFESANNKRIFNEWLRLKLKNNPGVSQLTSTSSELLHFLAKEIVAQIVEYTLVLRSNAKAQSLSSTDLTSNPRNKIAKPESGVVALMPEEVNEVMRRCHYSHNKPYQNVPFCIIF